MLPVDPDMRIVWGAFVISFYHRGFNATEIASRARGQNMLMTRNDVLALLRFYVDRFDKDVKITRETAS